MEILMTDTDQTTQQDPQGNCLSCPVCSQAECQKPRSDAAQAAESQSFESGSIKLFSSLKQVN